MIGKELECTTEQENQHSNHVISFHLRKNNQRKKVIGHIPDALSKVVDGLMLVWKFHQVTAKFDRNIEVHMSVRL